MSPAPPPAPGGPPPAPPRGRLLHFGFRATSADGRTVTDRIAAPNAAAALGALRERGFTAIQLLDDEQSAVQDADPGSRTRLQFTAAEEQALRRRRSLASRLLWTFNRNAVIWGPLLLWAIAARWHDPEHLPALPLALLTTFLLWFSWASVPTVMYQQALQASAWHRWAQVERWMRWLALWQRWFHVRMPLHELLVRRATALAGLGRLGEALELVAPLRTDPTLAATVSSPARFAPIYMAARNYLQAAQLQIQAHEQAPTVSTAIDLAFTRVRWLDDPAGAAALLAPIDAAPQPPLVRIFLASARGLVALAEGSSGLAILHFETALGEARAHAGTPLMQGMILDTRAHYGLALVAVGRRKEARAHFKAAMPLLKARGDHALIERCKAAWRTSGHHGNNGQGGPGSPGAPGAH